MKIYLRLLAASGALAVVLTPASARAVGTGDSPVRTADVPTAATLSAEHDYKDWIAARSGAPRRAGALLSDIPYEYHWTPTHLQERGYWCGPASVQTVDDYWGATASQTTIAARLGTTTNGTDFSLVDDALRYYSGKPYVYAGPLASGTEVLSRIEYGLDVRKNPMIGDFSVPATWPNYVYAHSGHIIPIEAFDWRYGTVRLNDPYDEADWMSGGGNTGGHKTYAKGLIASAVYNHWRRAVVY